MTRRFVCYMLIALLLLAIMASAQQGRPTARNQVRPTARNHDATSGTYYGGAPSYNSYAPSSGGGSYGGGSSYDGSSYDGAPSHAAPDNGYVRHVQFPNGSWGPVAN
jgi:hypothetical protein